jgi:hypothetical protein
MQEDELPVGGTVRKPRHHFGPFTLSTESRGLEPDTPDGIF